MSLTTDRKADIAYKYIKGVAQTGTSRASYEETHPYSLRVLPSQVWNEADSIPGTAPVLAPDAISGVVQYKEDLILNPEPAGANIVSFYHADLKHTIDPERFGASYLMTLKQNDDTPIPPGFGNYEINPDAGVVTFDEGTVIPSTPVKITFWKYVGAFGVGSSSGGSGILFVADNPTLRLVTDYAASVDKGVYSDANGQISVFKFDAANITADDDDGIIKPDDIPGGSPGRWIRLLIIPQLSKDVLLGDPPAGGDWANGISQYDGTEPLNKVLLDHEEYFSRIAPVKPQSVVAAVMSMSLYTALEENTGAVHNNLTDEDQPIGLLEDFYDPNSGDLTAEIDTVQDGSITLTAGDDTGFNLSLAITSNTDPHAGQGKPDEGWWMQLTAQVQASSSLSVGGHSYQMKLAGQGDNTLFEFIVDDPGVVTITSIVLDLPVSTTRMVSGVPSLDSAQSIACTFDVGGAVQSHYNQTRLARISGSQVVDVDIAPPGTPPLSGLTVSYVSELVQVAASAYSEDVNVSIQGYNSKDETGAIVPTNTGSRVDTLSDESNRLVAGVGEFPTAGYGGAFDSSISLVDEGSYEEELQLINGEYRRPTGDYTLNLPTAGPDYSPSEVLNTWDYCIPISVVALTNANSFDLNILGAVGFSDVETADLRVQVKVEGQTGWLDANSSFSLVGSPAADGDAAMVFTESSATTKKVTFGQTPRSGNLYVRIGLPVGDSKRFTGVSVTNIV